jgi:hypothetical protein
MPCPKADKCGGSATDPTCVPKQHGGREAAVPIAVPTGAGSSGVGKPSHPGALAVATAAAGCDFEAWAAEHGRRYPSAAERGRRAAVFAANCRERRGSGQRQRSPNCMGLASVGLDIGNFGYSIFLTIGRDFGARLFS